MKRLALLICLGASCLIAVAQGTSYIDSLKASQMNASNESELCLIKIQIATELGDSNADEALRYSSDAYSLALDIADTGLIVWSGRLKGQILRRTGQLQAAIVQLEKIEPIAKRHNFSDDYKKILNALAVAHMFKADYDRALEYNFRSLVVRQEEGNKAEISITLHNIGLNYYKLKNYETAIKYYNDALRIKEEASDSAFLEELYMNRGLCHVHLKKFKNAISDINTGLSLCGDHCSEGIRIQAQFGLGESSYWLGELEQAKKHFNESLAISEQINDKRFQAENHVYLAMVNLAQSNFSAAEHHLTVGDSLASRSKFNQLRVDIYRQFSKLYNITNDFKNTAYYQSRYIQLSDSIFREDLIKNIAKVESDYKERENMATIASNEIVIEQQRNLSIAIAVIALLTGLLVLVLQFGNRNIKRVNAKLSEAKEVIQEKNEELANKNKELDLLVERKTADLARANSSLKQVNDELDNFIYKTSHDIRGPLASLKGMCNVALMDVKDPVALDYLKKLDATAERLNTILTRLVIINQINNSKLTIEQIDFEGIVSDVLLLERKKGVPQELLIIPQIDENATIESDKELVRIVLENLIDNAIKFYNDSDRVKSFVKIHINAMPKGGVIVRVIDNGIGISESSPGKLFQMFSRASERSETGGIGLYITKTATEKIGGKVGLLTTPEGYTEFYVIFPATPFNESERMLRASSF